MKMLLKSTLTSALVAFSFCLAISRHELETFVKKSSITNELPDLNDTPEEASCFWNEVSRDGTHDRMKTPSLKAAENHDSPQSTPIAQVSLSSSGTHSSPKSSARLTSQACDTKSMNESPNAAKSLGNANSRHPTGKEHSYAMQALGKYGFYELKAILLQSKSTNYRFRRRIVNRFLNNHNIKMDPESLNKILCELRILPTEYKTSVAPGTSDESGITIRGLIKELRLRITHSGMKDNAEKIRFANKFLTDHGLPGPHNDRIAKLFYRHNLGKIGQDDVNTALGDSANTHRRRKQQRK